jgi:hypothetical protein
MDRSSEGTRGSPRLCPHRIAAPRHDVNRDPRRTAAAAGARQNLARLPDLAPEQGSTPLVLDEVKAAGRALDGAAQRRAGARPGEPPRKTATGHFRAE